MARNFDTVNEDHIEIGDVAALNITGNRVTLSVWAKLATNAMEHKILAKWSDSPAKFSYLLSINSSNKPLFAINTGSTTLVAGTTSIILGTWFHISGTYDGTTMRIYVDGVEENTTAKAWAGSPSSGCERSLNTSCARSPDISATPAALRSRSSLLPSSARVFSTSQLFNFGVIFIFKSPYSLTPLTLRPQPTDGYHGDSSTHP